jgi:hypothetical protein
MDIQERKLVQVLTFSSTSLSLRSHPNKVSGGTLQGGLDELSETAKLRRLLRSIRIFDKY